MKKLIRNSKFYETLVNINWFQAQGVLTQEQIDKEVEEQLQG